MIEELRKIKVAEVEREIVRLEATKLECKKYNWLERKILKTKQYEEEQKRIKMEEGRRRQEIAKLIEKKEKYESAQVVLQFGLSLEESVKLLEERGISAVLSENDFTNGYMPLKPSIDSLEDLILVHKTDYAPVDSRIKSVKEANSYVEETVTIARYEIPIRVRRSRNTVHFSTNGEVSSHLLGDWDGCKYAILVPFTDIPKDTIGSANAADTYTVGGVNLTPNSWILVPEGEKEKIKKDNPGINVIEYKGKSVSGYADQVVKLLGYHKEEIDNFSWRNYEDSRRHESIMYDNGLNLERHWDSVDKYNEEFETYMQMIVQVMQYVEEHRELLENNDFLNELTIFLREKSVRVVPGKNIEQELMNIQDYLLSESFVIPDENIRKIYEDIKVSNQSIDLNIGYYMPKEIIDLLKREKKEEKEYTEGRSR